MKIITISGLDGSGKSTQIQMLKTYLESQGKQVFYFHAIEFGVATKLAELKKKYCLICKIKGMCQVQPNIQKSVTKANWIQIQLRKLALKIDLWRFESLTNKLINSGYDYIVSDRFFDDTIINISYLENYIFFQNSKLKIQNSSSIYLQTDPQIIMQRKRKPDQGLQYLIDKKKLYDEYFQNFPKAKIIDGNRDEEIVFEEIKNAINR
jgi:thymidylate kinase